MSTLRICILCENRSNVTDQQTDDALERITYHKFPSNPERRDGWIEFCALPSGSFPKSAYKFLCSSHFADDCFERDLRGELLYGTKRMTLKKNAVPTIRTVGQHMKRTGSAPTSEEEHRKKRKAEVDKLMSGELPVTAPIANPFKKHICEELEANGRTNESVTPLYVLPPMSEQDMAQRIAELELETRRQREEIVKLHGTIQSKTEKMNFAKAELVNVAILLQELKERENRHVEERIEDILGGWFGGGQLALIMASSSEGNENQTTQNVHWTDDEVEKALKLRCISKEAFEYVREKLRYPLPDAPQLERWLHAIYLEPGHRTEAFQLLKLHAETLKHVERICTLSVSCTNTPVRFQYDPKRDQIVGPNSQLHCVTVQGIFSPWQQIVHTDFDLIFNMEAAEKIITELHRIGYHVVAITTGCDRKMLRIWETLNVNIEQHFIKHPVTGDAVYLYACPVRTMATIHRILLQDGFVMQENNLEITKASLLAVLPESSTICQRYLSTEILQEIENNPSFTREFISSATSSALKQLADAEDDEGGLLSTLATLFELFVDWYELCMTKSACLEETGLARQHLVTELPYGACEDEQNIVLDGMYDVMESMRCVNANYEFLPQAVLLSINSMRKLLADLREEYPDHVKAIPMFPLSTLPMHRTFCKLRENIQRIAPTFCPLSTNDVLFQLCKSIVLVQEGQHVTNLFLQKGALLGQITMESLHRKDAPVDPELTEVNEQNACDYLTHLIVSRLAQKYDYLGEATMVIERTGGQYTAKRSSGDALSSVKPSALWREQAKKLESYVSCMMHEKEDKLADGIIESILKLHPRMGRDLLELYVRARIAIRIRTLNAQLETDTELPNS